jgi:hypothetical protein
MFEAQRSPHSVAAVNSFKPQCFFVSPYSSLQLQGKMRLAWSDAEEQLLVEGAGPTLSIPMPAHAKTPSCRRQKIWVWKMVAHQNRLFRKQAF